MKLYIIAGEASGDLHGSNLILALKSKRPDIQIRCWGGELMKEAGGDVVKHYKDLAFMGFVEVLLNIKTILNNFDFCKKDILAFQPDAVVFIDYPGFNLRMAKFAKTNGFKVYYYISPQVWAWKQSRVKIIKQYVDRLFVILPFEKAFYQKFGVDATFVGHPLLDQINKNQQNNQWRKAHLLNDKPIIALLPGSRKQEILKILPLMLEVIPRFENDFQFVLAAAPSVGIDVYEKLVQHTGVKIIENQTYAILRESRVALVTSGTATLETALFRVPQVVCYKANSLSVFIARKLIKVPYISLVNLIMDRKIVEELIQDDLNLDSIIKELEKILPDGQFRQNMLKGYDELILALGEGGASEKVAEGILNHV
jgi:lipid-A-disaccharide synthase